LGELIALSQIPKLEFRDPTSEKRKSGKRKRKEKEGGKGQRKKRKKGKRKEKKRGKNPLYLLFSALKEFPSYASGQTAKRHSGNAKRRHLAGVVLFPRVLS